MKKLLWLDDIRDPFANDGEWLAFSPISRPYEVHWVKSYQEFIDWISENGMPDAVCFDHDLGDEGTNEKTGYDCAKWLVDTAIDSGDRLPEWGIQSANPVGAENINRLLTNFKKFTQIQEQCS